MTKKTEVSRKILDLSVGAVTSATAVNPNDIVNLAQVQSIAEGLAVTKEAVATHADSDVDIATGGLLILDGYQTVAGDRVLLDSQTDATENGIYDVAVGSWTRSADADTQAELKPASTVRILNGDHAGRVYQLTNSTNPAPDTDVQTWVVIGASSNKAIDTVVVDTSFTQVSGVNSQSVFDSIDNKLQDLHDERKAFTSTTLATETAVTFNHALNNQFLGSIRVAEASSPYTDITSQVNIEYTDANNVTIQNDGAAVDVIVTCSK